MAARSAAAAPSRRGAVAAVGSSSTFPALLAVVLLVAELYGADAGPCYRPNATVRANAWVGANLEGFVYPELDQASAYALPKILQRENFGIAVSGGGYRAVTLALGYVRGLWMLNLVQQSRYLSSNSGGSWFNTAFSYQDSLPVNEFLGPYVPPQNLTLDNLKDVSNGAHGAFANTITDAGIKLNAAAEAVGDLLTGSERGPGAWSNSIGDAFLSPYELNADKSTFSANGTRGPIHQALSAMDVKTYYYQGATDRQTEGNITRPYPIVLGTIFHRRDNTSTFYPVEFSPLYVGCPPAYPDPKNGNDTIGGGLVDTVAFNSAPPDPVPTVPPSLAGQLGRVPPGFNQFKAPAAPEAAPSTRAPSSGRHLLQAATATASPKAPAAAPAAAAPSLATSANLVPVEVNSTFLLPLKIAAGISSSFLAQGLRPNAEALQELTGTEKLDYWNQVNFKGQEQSFADGGGTDNLAITPLLRRKVATIVSCIAGSEPLNGNVSKEDWTYGQWDISSLFGAVPLNNKAMKKGQVNGMSPQKFNAVSQVFPRSGWDELFKGLKATSDAGGPAYHLAEYTVMDNPYQGIHGGWKVKVLWVINAVQKNWENALPDEVLGTITKSRLTKGGLYEKDRDAAKGTPDEGKAKDELRMFPYISTMDANYSPELVGLLSQMATWQMLQLRPQLAKLLTGTKVVVDTAHNVGVRTRDAQVGEPTKSVSAAGGRDAGGSLLLRAATAAGAAALLAGRLALL